MKNSTNLKDTKQKDVLNIRWMLVGYDLIVYAIVASLLLAAYGGTDKLSSTGILQQVCLSAVCIFAVRLLGKIYGQVWRYGGIQCYIRLLFTDAIAFLVYLCLELLLPIQKITFARMLSLVSLNLLGALALLHDVSAMHTNVEIRKQQKESSFRYYYISFPELMPEIRRKYRKSKL